jgi:hypothetical protein
MCFGGGGGGQAATIVMPDTGAYDRQFDLQKSAIESQMNNNMISMQQQLQGSLRKKEDLLTQIRDVKVQSASSQQSLNEQVARMASLVGPPPPEKSAQAPTVGTQDRGVATKKGKSALRISRTTASSNGQGSGLNII